VSRNAAMVLGAAQSRPEVALPPGACDCHVHIFEPERFSLGSHRTYRPDTATVADLLALQEAVGLSRMVLIQPSPYGSDNACLLDGLRKLEGRVRGVAVIDDATPSSVVAELRAAGVRGLRVNLETYGGTDPAHAAEAIRAAASRAAGLGWHVQVHAKLALLAAIAPTLRELPAPLVIDHFAYASAHLGPRQPGFDVLCGLLRSGKAYVKLSAAHRISTQPDGADVAPIAQSLIAANPDRVLWGSDWPHTGEWPGAERHPDRVERFHPVDDGRALDRLRTWTRDADEVHRILVANPARLYDF
jgi:predicted TIM-barrel fold metal-dependent hydrolase